MKDFQRRQDNFFNKGSSQDGLQIIQLSLFIMLLAFFIVLNITSNFKEERVEPAIKSLYKAFYTDKYPSTVSATRPDPEIVKSLQQEEAADYIRELFKSDMPGLTLQKTSRDDVLYVTFNRAEFESFIDSQNVTSFDRIIAALIFLDQKNMPMAIDLTLNEDANAGRNIQERFQTLSNYAQELIRRGVNEKLVSVSLSNNTVEGEDVVVVFRPYYGFTPVGDSAQNAGGRDE